VFNWQTTTYLTCPGTERNSKFEILIAAALQKSPGKASEVLRGHVRVLPPLFLKLVASKTRIDWLLIVKVAPLLALMIWS